MRLAVLGIGLALAGTAVPAGAQAPAATPPLAQGEVLLELGSIGTAIVPADLATISMVISGRGETEAAAQADRDLKYQRVVAAARQAGLPMSAITRDEFDEPGRQVIEVPLPPPPRVEPPATTGPGSPSASVLSPTPRRVRAQYASSRVVVRVTDIGRVASLRRALDAAAENEFGNSGPIYSLIDSRAARQTARAQALAAVRADAEAYAASLGMRVARIVRVSERTGVGLLPQLLGDSSMMRRAFGPAQNRDPQITVFVVVGVDFALAPR